MVLTTKTLATAVILMAGLPISVAAFKLTGEYNTIGREAETDTKSKIAQAAQEALSATSCMSVRFTFDQDDKANPDLLFARSESFVALCDGNLQWDHKYGAGEVEGQQTFHVDMRCDGKVTTQIDYFEKKHAILAGWDDTLTLHGLGFFDICMLHKPRTGLSQRDDNCLLALATASNVSVREQTEIIDGVPCYVLDRKYTLTGTVDLTVWVEVDRPGLARRQQYFAADGSIVVEYGGTKAHEVAPGVFVWIEGYKQSNTPAFGKIRSVLSVTHSVPSTPDIVINPELSEDYFRPKPSSGYMYLDTITGEGKRIK